MTPENRKKVQESIFKINDDVFPLDLDEFEVSTDVQEDISTGSCTCPFSLISFRNCLLLKVFYNHPI